MEPAVAILNDHPGEARAIAIASRLSPPFIDKAGANIRAPRHLGHHRARLLDRRQNPRPLFVTPSPTPLVARDQCHPTHAVQLASLIKPT